MKGLQQETNPIIVPSLSVLLKSNLHKRPGFTLGNDRFKRRDLVIVSSGKKKLIEKFVCTSKSEISLSELVSQTVRDYADDNERA